jgi:hypothetical protein
MLVKWERERVCVCVLYRFLCRVSSEYKSAAGNIQKRCFLYWKIVKREKEGKSFWGPGEKKCISNFQTPLPFEITFCWMDCFVILQREYKIIKVTLAIHGSYRHVWRWDVKWMLTFRTKKKKSFVLNSFPETFLLFPDHQIPRYSTYSVKRWQLPGGIHTLHVKPLGLYSLATPPT